MLLRFGMSHRSYLSILFVVGLLLVLGGCPFSIKDNMNSWIGHHRDELITTWGPPTSETSLTNGGRSLVYIQVYGSSIGGQGSVSTCRKVFVLDSNLIIRNWSFYGC